jgi:hypothetical protein
VPTASEGRWRRLVLVGLLLAEGLITRAGRDERRRAVIDGI